MLLAFLYLLVFSGLGAGVATFLATPSSANLASALTDETGTGANVFATSPTLVTPDLGTPSAINLTNATAVPTDATKANIASPTFTGTVTIPTGAVISLLRSIYLQPRLLPIPLHLVMKVSCSQ
jgi:hypothetical protein